MQQFAVIYRVIQSGKFKSIKKEMQKDWPIIKEWMDKYRAMHPPEKTHWYWWLGIPSLLLLVFLFFLVKWALLYRYNLYRAKKAEKAVR